jgi:mono/diheme cytochrome c family protein
MRTLLAISLSLASILAAGGATADSAQRGFVFVKTNCSSCHAIGHYDQSPLPLAPPFRTLHQRYPVENLEESLAEGIVTGHPSMPEFQLDGAEINQLIDYLKTLE